MAFCRLPSALLCAINSRAVQHFCPRGRPPRRGERVTWRVHERPPAAATCRRAAGRLAHPPAPAAAPDRRLHLGAAHLRPVAHHGREGGGPRRPVARHRAFLLRLQGRDAGRIAALSGRGVRGAGAGAGGAASRQSPVQALELLVDLYLDADIASPRKVSVWYAFWGEASSRQEYYDICGKKDEEFAAAGARADRAADRRDRGAATWMPTAWRSD